MWIATCGEKIVLNLPQQCVQVSRWEGEIDVPAGDAGVGRPRLTVRDTGVGIPSEELPHMFERFSTGSK